MKTKEQLQNDYHYFDLGMMQGKRKFNHSSFIWGIIIGVQIGYFLFKFL